MFVGLDEAGRGPVIGPMIVVGIKCDPEKIALIGVKDSKKISPKRREELFSEILNIVDDYSVRIVKPEEIDKAINSEYSNLSKLEMDKFKEIILELRPKKAYLDCPSSNKKGPLKDLKEEFDQIFNQNGKIISAEETFLFYDNLIVVSEHKADDKYAVVSGASIIAKVIRDREIEKIKEEVGYDFGSGYPADPKTKEFIKENWYKYPNIFRKTWSTWKKCQTQSSQKSLSDF